MKVYRLSLPAATGLAFVLAAAVGVLSWQPDLDTTTWLAAVATTALLLAGFVFWGSGSVVERLRAWLAVRPARIVIFPVALWSLYVFYALGTETATPSNTLLVALYLAGPFLLLVGGPQSPGARPTWLEPIALLWLWLPIEIEWLRSTLYVPGLRLHYVLGQLLGVNLALAAFALWRRLPGIGYRCEWRPDAFRTVAISFLQFATVAIPLGLGIGFIRYSYSAEKWREVPLALSTTFLFTALPEELLFRGLIQNWLELRTRNRRTGLLLAALIFGAAHLNNGPPYPNWHYFLMASIAGVFYGRAWQRTGSLLASALTHTLVNTAWGLFFH
ncbi:MAG: lysostaphin resistance A-like protein [Terriglobia bacterium]